MKNKYIQIAFALLFVSTMFGQQIDNFCGTTESYIDYMNKHPEAAAQRMADEVEWTEIDKILTEQRKNKALKTNNVKANNISNASGVIYTIPVVFHVLHLNGSENISDAQIKNAVANLNADFAGLSPDTINTQLPFQGLEADCEMRFELATIDPSGNCTNGITRHYDANTDWVKGTTPFSYTWDRTKYYNIYVVKSFSTPIAGYSSFPGMNGAAADVTVILHNYVGNIGTGSPSLYHALTHETGHFFNLFHIWDCCTQPGTGCGTDNVGDTPQTKGFQSCASGTGVQICNPPISENVNNFMDYAYCYTMFTAGQATRMRNVIINNTGNVGRSNLASSTNLINTGVTNPQVCVPIADFNSNKTYVCANGTVTFSDNSQNATPTGWAWSFTGGSPSSSTASNPVITYPTPGVYPVTYTATTSAGSNSITKSSYITVLSAVAGHQTFWNEGFESVASFPSTEWNADNIGGGNTWSVGSVGYTGTKSAKMNNFGNTANEVDELVGPSVNIDSIYDLMGAASVTFKVAYQQKATTNIDKLQLLTSIDCGATWVSKWSKQGTTLATTTTGTSAFTPSSTTQWRNETVNLISLLGQKNVKFKFKFTSDASAPGNNLYVDDININGINAIAPAIENVLDMNIFPNPTEGSSSISFNLDAKHNVQLFVSNVLGQTVETVAKGEMSTGEYVFKLNKDLKYKSGIYLVNLLIDGKMFTRKLIIE